MKCTSVLSETELKKKTKKQVDDRYLDEELLT